MVSLIIEESQKSGRRLALLGGSGPSERRGDGKPKPINAAEGGKLMSSYEELMIVFSVLMIVVTLIIALIGAKK